MDQPALQSSDEADFAIVLEAIDASGSHWHPDRCVRCQQHERADGELCVGCRALLFGDSDEGPGDVVELHELTAGIDTMLGRWKINDVDPDSGRAIHLFERDGETTITLAAAQTGIVFRFIDDENYMYVRCDPATL